MSRPRVASLKSTRVQPGDVYVGRGRGSVWGNPFPLNAQGTNRTQVIAQYREWISARPELVERLRKLEPARLLCWCAPLPCHADVLAELLAE